MMGPNDNAHRLGHPIPLHWLSWAFVDLCVPSLACIGLRGHSWAIIIVVATVEVVGIGGDMVTCRGGWCWQCGCTHSLFNNK